MCQLDVERRLPVELEGLARVWGDRELVLGEGTQPLTEVLAPVVSGWASAPKGSDQNEQYNRILMAGTRHWRRGGARNEPVFIACALIEEESAACRD